MDEGKILAILGIVITIAAMVAGLFAVFNSHPCNKENKQYQCIDGALYKDVGDMLVSTGKRCIAK